MSTAARRQRGDRINGTGERVPPADASSRGTRPAGKFATGHTPANKSAVAKVARVPFGEADTTHVSYLDVVNAFRELIGEVRGLPGERAFVEPAAYEPEVYGARD